MSEQSAKNQPSVNNPYQQHNDEIDLRHLIAMLLDGRFIIGGVIAIAFAVAFVICFFTKNTLQIISELKK